MLIAIEIRFDYVCAIRPLVMLQRLFPEWNVASQARMRIRFAQDGEKRLLILMQNIFLCWQISYFLIVQSFALSKPSALPEVGDCS